MKNTKQIKEKLIRLKRFNDSSPDIHDKAELSMTVGNIAYTLPSVSVLIREYSEDELKTLPGLEVEIEKLEKQVTDSSIGLSSDEEEREDEESDIEKQKGVIYETHIRCGEMYNQRMQFDKALEHFTKALPFDPDDDDEGIISSLIAMVYTNQGNDLLSKHKFTEAIEAYSQCIEVEGGAETYHNLGMAYTIIGKLYDIDNKLSAATGAYDKALRNYLSEIRIQKGDGNQGEFDYSDALYNLGKVGYDFINMLWLARSPHAETNLDFIIRTIEECFVIENTIEESFLSETVGMGDIVEER